MKISSTSEGYTIPGIGTYANEQEDADSIFLRPTSQRAQRMLAVHMQGRAELAENARARRRALRQRVHEDTGKTCLIVGLHHMF